ncbi:hypothetical protein D5S18_30340 [Nocardia panacis]|uniref:Uncharacterized protein n=1 Tax=Nocardia panacis TaxID=2340916 RepID=A0A3A4JLF4_9NOCA|nr:hypothetical protein [Nocardia panacis]RJO69460.1 hypothetical protein D5S18_30340 [Nocardia panacis]
MTGSGGVLPTLRTVAAMAALIGLVVLALGLFGSTADPNRVPNCGATPMLPGTSCADESGSFTYEAKMAEQRHTFEVADQRTTLGADVAAIGALVNVGVMVLLKWLG